ncbi:MAG: large conductance mechanosensitive channel protein MscL [Gemmatimonadaceae bacterium]
MMSEFKEFATKGSVMDLAIGVVIGGAFGKIVDSLVNDILMPPIGYLISGVDFKSLFVTLKGGPYASLEAAKAAGAPTINYGNFINQVLTFLIVAWVLFMIVKGMNRLRRNLPAVSSVVIPVEVTKS